MKRLRNQDDKLPSNHRFAIRSVAGVCPSCALTSAVKAALSREQSMSMKELLGVIYRRSEHSITFKCSHCGLKWTVTLANLNKVARAKIDSISDEMLKRFYDYVIFGTQFAADDEAERSNTIKRQTTRRVIRLPDKSY
jgi:predicted RNA-binding Zn-ribbon protein involved in translation (DUF1610 family)